MSTSSLSLFFAMLSLGCWLGVIAVVVLAVLRRREPGGFANDLWESLRPIALWLAWLVATVTMLGSLYYSLGAHFLPCELCWYQRICVYPLAAVLLVAALRRDASVWRYVVPLTLIGGVIAAYHSQLQAFPEQRSFCLATNPCTVRYVWELGFVSLPLMDLSALALITALVLLARTTPTLVEEAA
jgi:disulfide bond formation protein DsbB